MAPTRKRHKTQSSQASSIQGNPEDDPIQETSKEGDFNPPTSTADPPSGSGRTTDQEELKRAQKVAANSNSSSYSSYGVPQLSNQLDKYGRRMIAYPCKLCGTKISRPTSDTSCSNLNKHALICIRKQRGTESTRSLSSLGITRTGKVQAKEVPQLCAIWCAEAARPFSALTDVSHKAILHPTVIKNLPRLQDVSKHIHMLYSAIQNNYQGVLSFGRSEHKRALYLGVDAWQSPNGFDILGVVVYRLAEVGADDISLEAMPLDFVRLSQSHTGEYLAKTVALVADKFGIQDRICGIVSDNAKNNEVMVKELKKLKWPRFKGEPHWIQCFAHILNLIVQAILRPFGTQKQKKTANGRPISSDVDSDESQSEDGDAEEKIRVELQSLSGQDDDDDDSLTEADIENASEEDEGDDYTTDSCKLTLAKFCRIAKKLRFSPNSKAEFVEICREKECNTPHIVERDVCTRWNSTFYQMKSIVRCEAAVLEWQRHKRHGLKRKHHLKDSDIKLARDLVNVLAIFQYLTLQVSNAGSTRLANIVIYIDQITEHLSTIISDQKYPSALRNACRHGLKITNKYYSLTDTSPLYRIAILMHPSFKDEYFKMAKWEPDWIAEAIRYGAPSGARPAAALGGEKMPKRLPSRVVRKRELKESK
ncbi:hypothetical protein PTTG_29479 [Puccinia triticina 1-1 BBBD Race 1]|uniref:DUF659 domain-containing protein n=1 Tax=Puccinia triticina (isolate 1-1 / race 1 (BBBD)) TaxID=630390 RepID=A0A180G3U6_PUCT1|nr:hypothetical protein PTTG_29479 [Puccinia triticina 1-1 BBBD Race 1]